MHTTIGSLLRRAVVLSLVLGLFVVAAPRAFADPIPRETGISGLVVLRTECAQPSACLRTAGQAMVTAVAEASGGATYRALTAPDGIFVLWLTPGTYRVSATTLNSVPQQSKPTTVRVDPGFMVDLRIVIQAH